MGSEKKNTKKHTNFTLDDIKEYLNYIRKAVIENKYTISINENRQENKRNKPIKYLFR